MRLHKELGLYANIRPFEVFLSLLENSPLKREVAVGTDFTIYRKPVGGIYFGERKTNDTDTVASDLCEYSEKEISRIAHLVLKVARNRKGKLTLIEKAYRTSIFTWKGKITRFRSRPPPLHRHCTSPWCACLFRSSTI